MYIARDYRLLGLALLIVMLLVVGCGRKQHISFSYSFAISPKKGEVLKDVTVYLPFPTKDGKPMMEIYESLERHYKKYHQDDTPGLSLSVIDTEYGPMIKIEIAQLSQGVGLEGGYGFEESFSKESVAPRFPINPRLNQRRLEGSKTGNFCDSYIYAKFSNAKEIGVALDYEISAQSPSLLPLDYTPDSNYYAHLGWDRVPGNSEVLVKYFPGSGWLKVPLVDLGHNGE